MKTKLTILLFAVLFLASCAGTSSNNNTTQQADSTKATPQEPSTKWVYSSDKNQMDDTETFYAQVDAEEKLNFQFPYGEETASLIIRSSSKSNEVLLTITNGQFMSNLMGDRHINVRFDEDKATPYSYSDPSDASTTVIFISDPGKFINRLKTAKTVLIQAEFFNEGNITMKFLTDGFKWEH